MIITQDKNKQVVQSHDFDSVNCTIDAEDMRYVASLLRNNYSNPPLAVVREISANALDANMEANASRKVEVTIPSKFNAHFVVRDFGGGLSQEDIFGLYSKYGKSTKRNSNNYIGAFGIGKFAPLSYGSSFSVVSYHGGLKSTYNVFVNDDDDTKIIKFAEEPSDEPTGLSVEVAIADDDVDRFRDVCKNFFRFFSEEDMPKFIGVGEDEKFFDDFEVVMEAQDKSWWILDDKQDYWSKNHHQGHAVMGRVHYPIDVSAINFDSICEDGDADSEKLARNLRDLVSQDNVYIRFDIGQLKLHHSRESLEYNKATQQQILSTLKKVQQEIEEIAKEKLENAVDIWDAKAQYAQVVNALPRGVRDIFANSFSWNGVKIESMSIDRSYKYQDNVIITEYWKEDDEDATDGYKIRSSKHHRIYPHKNHALVVQDMKSNHGNALRARTLFKENEELHKVFVVFLDGDDAEEYAYDISGMQFNLINKERILYSSNIEKAKLQSRGKAVRGESRGDVPLFELDIDGENRYKTRNTDFWLNRNQNIDELESTDRELIYLPIANYKVVEEDASGQEESVTLDSIVRSIQGIRTIMQQEQDGEVDFPLVIGVRRKDCKKLTKSRWESWANYKKNFAKSYLVNHKKEVLDSEKARAFADNQYNMKNYVLFSNLLDNPKFHQLIRSEITDKNHLWNQIIDDMELMKNSDDKQLQTISSLVNFMTNVDSEWVEQNIPSTYDVNDFDNKCKELSDKYPLLVNLSAELYRWKDLDEHNLGKNMIDYILMCDLV